jgi:hypothetical protein
MCNGPQFARLNTRWECLGEAYIKLGKYVAAIKALNRALVMYDASAADDSPAPSIDTERVCLCRIG